MKDISYYHKDAIESRMSTRNSIGHHVTQYKRHTEYGVVQIYYHIDITKKMAVLGGLLVIPGLLYLGDQAFNDGGLCTHEETHYFDADSGQEILFSQAQENKNKNKQADLLDREGNELHGQGKYKEAYDKFNQAYQKCTSGYSKEARFKNNRDIAKNNWAEELNKQGNKLWEQNNYFEAVEKYNQAYQKCTKGYKNEQAFKNNRDKAQVELDAANLNSQGDNFFRQGKYSEAQGKYQEAYDKSEVSKEYNEYKANRDKAKAELDAVDLNNEGNALFESGDFSGAKDKYQQAYDISEIAKQNDNFFGRLFFRPHEYKSNKDKAQTIINKLSILDALWNKGWDAENDRYEEAEEIFQKVLNEAKDSLKIFPDNLKLKQYETLVLLKIEGNELFNKGIESQQKGVSLLQKAQKLKQQQSYKLANIKFQEAKDKFSDAQKKFEKGSENDQRFVSCIELVEDQIKEVTQSIKITERELHTLNQEFFSNLDINISNDNHLESNHDDPDTIGAHNHYYEQQI
jgi:tetratricopeptide (TPR) repeat protein